MIKRGYKSNHKIAGSAKHKEQLKIPCDICKAWKEDGTEYFLCGVQGICPALADNDEEAAILYEEQVAKITKINEQFDKQIKG